MSVFDGLQLPKVIYETDSELNGHIQVVQIGETRKIKVNKIDQSISHHSPNCERLYWGKTVDLIKEEFPEMRSFLILGFGGGTIAHLVSAEFPETQIVGVELDKKMIEIARDYFDAGKIPNLTVLNADALRLVVDPPEYGLAKSSFDVVLVDIYVGQDYPDLGSSGNFVAAVKSMVMPGGMLIFNRIYLEHHQDDVNVFIDFLRGFLHDVKFKIVAGYSNSDNVLIYGRV